MAKKEQVTKGPFGATLEAGVKYAYCTCAQSETYPWCDGTHRRCGGKPLKWIQQEDATAKLCRCRKSGNFPFCDGSHAE